MRENGVTKVDQRVEGGPAPQGVGIPIVGDVTKANTLQLVMTGSGSNRIEVWASAKVLCTW